MRLDAVPWGGLALAAGAAGTTALVVWYGATAIGAEVVQAAWALPPL